jgi:hypothetical protein
VIAAIRAAIRAALERAEVELTNDDQPGVRLRNAKRKANWCLARYRLFESG